MIPEINAHREELMRLCHQYHVSRLELFGSAVTGEYNPATSDLDFSVELEPLEPGEYADTYFGLLEELQILFGRPVDLVMTSAIKNPYFRRSMEQTKTLLYEA